MTTPTHAHPAAPRPVNPHEGSQRAADAFTADIISWQAAAPGRRPPGPAADFTREAVSTLEGVPGLAAAARAEVERLHGDDTIAPEGKSRLIGERISKLETDIATAQARARANATQAHAEYTQAALGQVPKADQLAAREDLKIFLAGLAPADVPARVAELASRDDHVGWLAAGNVGAMLIEASGTDRSTAGHYRKLAQRNAMAAAAASADQARAQAAAHAAHLSRLTGTLDWPSSLSRIAADELRRRTGQVRRPG